MANITLSIPDSLHKRLKKHREIRWSETIRAMLEKRLEDFERMEEIASKSKLTQKDADEIARKIKRGIAKRHGLIFNKNFKKSGFGALKGIGKFTRKDRMEDRF